MDTVDALFQKILNKIDPNETLKLVKSAPEQQQGQLFLLACQKDEPVAVELFSELSNNVVKSANSKGQNALSLALEPGKFFDLAESLICNNEFGDEILDQCLSSALAPSISTWVEFTIKLVRDGNDSCEVVFPKLIRNRSWRMTVIREIWKLTDEDVMIKTLTYLETFAQIKVLFDFVENGSILRKAVTEDKNKIAKAILNSKLPSMKVQDMINETLAQMENKKQQATWLIKALSLDQLRMTRVKTMSTANSKDQNVLMFALTNNLQDIIVALLGLKSKSLRQELIVEALTTATDENAMMEVLKQITDIPIKKLPVDKKKIVLSYALGNGFFEAVNRILRVVEEQADIDTLMGLTVNEQNAKKYAACLCFALNNNPELAKKLVSLEALQEMTCQHFLSHADDLTLLKLLKSLPFPDLQKWIVELKGPNNEQNLLLHSVIYGFDKVATFILDQLEKKHFAADLIRIYIDDVPTKDHLLKLVKMFSPAQLINARTRSQDDALYYCVNKGFQEVVCWIAEHSKTLVEKLIKNHNDEMTANFIKMLPFEEQKLVKTPTGTNLLCDSLQAKLPLVAQEVIANFELRNFLLNDCLEKHVHIPGIYISLMDSLDMRDQDVSKWLLHAMKNNLTVVIDKLADQTTVEVVRQCLLHIDPLHQEDIGCRLLHLLDPAKTSMPMDLNQGSQVLDHLLGSSTLSGGNALLRDFLCHHCLKPGSILKSLKANSLDQSCIIQVIQLLYSPCGLMNETSNFLLVSLAMGHKKVVDAIFENVQLKDSVLRHALQLCYSRKDKILSKLFDLVIATKSDSLMQAALDISISSFDKNNYDDQGNFHKGVVERLLSTLPISVRSSKNDTLLHLAVQTTKSFPIKIVQERLAAGDEETGNAKNDVGETCLTSAVQQRISPPTNTKAMIEVILKIIGLDLTSTTKEGKNVLRLACQNSLHEVVNLLLQYAAEQNNSLCPCVSSPVSMMPILYLSSKEKLFECDMKIIAELLQHQCSNQDIQVDAIVAQSELLHKIVSDKKSVQLGGPNSTHKKMKQVFDLLNVIPSFLPAVALHGELDVLRAMFKSKSGCNLDNWVQAIKSACCKNHTPVLRKLLKEMFPNATTQEKKQILELLKEEMSCKRLTASKELLVAATEFTNTDIVTFVLLEMDIEEKKQCGDVLLGLFKPSRQDMLELLLRENEIPLQEGWNPFNRTLGSGNEFNSRIKRLLHLKRKGIKSITQLDPEGHSYLHQNIDTNDLNELKEVLQDPKAQPLLHIKDIHDQTPLVYAAKNEKIEICNLFVSCGASISEPDLYGCNPVHHAVLLKNEKLLQVLLQGPDLLMVHESVINHMDKGQQTPFYHAIECTGSPNMEIVSLLLPYANMDLQYTDTKDTILQILCRQGNEKILSIILEKKKDELECVLLQNKLQQNVLATCVNFRRICMLSQILSAVSSTSTDVLKKLLCLADQADGNTVLHFAIISGENDIAFELLKQPLIEVTIRNQNGHTALDLAIKMRAPEIVERILEISHSIDNNCSTRCPFEVSPDLQSLLLLNLDNEKQSKQIAMLLLQHEQKYHNATYQVKLLVKNVTLETTNHQLHWLANVLCNNQDLRRPFFEHAAAEGKATLVLKILESSDAFEDIELLEKNIDMCCSTNHHEDVLLILIPFALQKIGLDLFEDKITQYVLTGLESGMLAPSERLLQECLNWDLSLLVSKILTKSTTEQKKEYSKFVEYSLLKNKKKCLESLLLDNDIKYNSDFWNLDKILWDQLTPNINMLLLKKVYGFTNLSATTADGKTILEYAIDLDLFDTFQYILSMEPEQINLLNVNTKEIPLVYCSRLRLPHKYIHHLLDNEALVSICNNSKKTALHYICEDSTQYDLVKKVLTCKDADSGVNVQDTTGRTALQLAVLSTKHSQDRADIIKCLVNFDSVQFDLQDTSSKSVLHHAVVRKDIATVQSILQSAKVTSNFVNLKDTDDKTALHHAFEIKHQAGEAIIEILLCCPQVDLTVGSESGSDVLSCALKMHNRDQVDVILSAAHSDYHKGKNCPSIVQSGNGMCHRPLLFEIKQLDQLDQLDQATGLLKVLLEHCIGCGICQITEAMRMTEVQEMLLHEKSNGLFKVMAEAFKDHESNFLWQTVVTENLCLLKKVLQSTNAEDLLPSGLTSAIRHAIVQGNIDILNELIEMKTEPHCAQLVQCLKEHKHSEDFFSKTTTNEDTLLHLSVKWEHEELIKILLTESSVPKNLTNKQDETAVTLAIRKKAYPCLRLLLAAKETVDFGHSKSVVDAEQAEFWDLPEDICLDLFLCQNQRTSLTDLDTEGYSLFHHAVAFTGTILISASCR